MQETLRHPATLGGGSARSLATNLHPTGLLIEALHGGVAHPRRPLLAIFGALPKPEKTPRGELYIVRRFPNFELRARGFCVESEHSTFPLEIPVKIQ